MQKIRELDGIRAMAILAVLSVHVYAGFRGGFVGVDLFFVLSGFLITSLLIAEKRSIGTVNLRDFYIRRSLRILPPLFAGIALVVLLLPPAQRGQLETAIPAALFFYANFLDSKELPYLAHTWSLAIEEQFYLVWPLVFVLMRNHVRALVALVVITLALRIALYALGSDAEFLYRFTFTRMDSLAAGCAAAFMTKRESSDWTVAALFCAVIAALMLPEINTAATITVGHTFFAVLFAAFIVSMFGVSAAHPVRRLLSSRVLEYIGKRSYGLYIFHVPIFAATESFKDSSNLGLLNFALLALARVAATFAVAELSFRTIEAVARALKERYYPRHVAAIIAPGT